MAAKKRSLTPVKVTAPLKPVFEDDFDNWCLDEFRKKPHELNKAARSREFIRWYLCRVHNGSNSPTVDEDSIDEGLVDRSGDIGCDYVYRDGEEGSALVIQAKFRDSRDAKEDDVAIREFGETITRLRNPDGDWLTAYAHEGIRDFARTIDWERDQLTLIFLTNAEPTERALTQFSDVKRRLEGEHSPLRVLFHHRSELNALVRQTTGQPESLPGNIQFFYQEILQLEKSCVAVVAAHQIAEMYNKGGKLRLFSENIRNHLGQTDINKEMERTLRTTPNDFYFYNNGISCIATSFRVDSKSREIVASGLQVINGAQTVKTIADIKADARLGASDESLRQAQVLVRITERGLRGEMNIEFSNNIIRYNNSQNAIKEQDFANRDKIQLNIAEQFARLTRKDKRVKYGLRRGDTPRNAEMVKVTQFGQRVLAFLDSPIAAGNSLAKLFAREGDPYTLVFCAGLRGAVVLAHEDFQLRAGIWWLSLEFERLRKPDAQSQKYLSAVDNLPIILWAARVLLERTYGTAYRGLVVAAHRGDWDIHGNRAEERRFKMLYEATRSFLVEDIGQQLELAKEKGKAFKPTEWRRAKGTYARLAKRAETTSVTHSLETMYPLNS